MTYRFKVCLIGPTYGGKTCLLRRFVNHRFPDIIRATIGTAYVVFTGKIGGSPVKLYIWDVAGPENVYAIYLRGATGIMLVYDITSVDSIQAMHICISRIDSSAPANVVKMLVGNKCDCEVRREVSTEQGRQLAEDHGMSFMEVSAKTGFNVDKAFYTLARDCLIQRLVNSNPTIVSHIHEKRGELYSFCQNCDCQILINIITYNVGYITFPFYVSCDHDSSVLLKLLLKNCHPAMRDWSGNPPLHLAARYGLMDVVRELISERHCDPSDKNNEGQMCLHVACKFGQINAVKWFIQMRCNPNDEDRKGQNCLHIACQEGHSDIIEFLVSGEYCNLNDKDNNGHNCLHIAYMGKRNSEKFETVKYLMKRIENVDEKDKNGQTCLQWACKEGYVDIVEFLICSRHCNANNKDEYGQTCLQVAGEGDSVTILRLLICQGHCDPFVRNELGLTVLHIAAAATHKSVEVVQYLVEEVGIDPASTDNLGQTPLHVSARKGNHDIVKYLLSTGRVNILLRDTHGNTALDLTISGNVLKLISDAKMKLKQQLVPQKPPEPSVSVFIVGYPSVGKTTLVKALTREASGLSALPGFIFNVSTDPQTAGIIPTDFVSKVFGQVTFFDLAGQNQYYASHAAVIQSAISSAAPVFLLVVKLPETEEDIKQRILAFLENQCKEIKEKPHIIIVGSHADKSQAIEEPVRRRLWENIQNYSKSFLLVKLIPLDCRKSESAGISQLRQSLKTSCDTLRQEAKKSWSLLPTVFLFS